MGVTLFFSGELENQTALKRTIDAARSFAAEMDWAAESLNAPSAELRRLAGPDETLDPNTTSMRIAKRQFENVYSGPVFGVALYPHPDCEPLRLEFDDQLFVQQYVKTQFAGPECHAEVCSLLKKLEPYFTRFSAADEGGYWETFDPVALKSQFDLARSALEVLREQDPHGEFRVDDEEGRIVDFVDSLGKSVNISVLPPGFTPESAAGLQELVDEADNDNPEAMRDLAVRYRLAEGVGEDFDRAFDLLRRAAALGDLQAQALLGVCYRYGEGVDSNEGTATYWFRKAAEEGNALAEYMLGDCYKLGLGVVQDDAEAVVWFRRAAEQGLADAQFALGVSYYRGRGAPTDETEAVSWLTKAAEQGQDFAMNLLGECHRFGFGAPVDMQQAAHWYQLSAEKGNAYGQFHLAECLRTGQGVAIDFAEAMRQYRLAAEEGHQGAEIALAGEVDFSPVEDTDPAEAKQRAATGEAHGLFLWGQCLFAGAGVEQDSEQAVEAWLPAAEQGHVDAQLMLAYAYRDGEGVEANQEQSLYWYSTAANVGHAGAIVELAFHEFFAEGGDEELAVARFREAADLGNGLACDMLGECLLHGMGVEPDEPAAVEYFRKAADRSISTGIVNLANCYRDGTGVNQNECEAVRYYLKAASLDESNWACRIRLGDCYLSGYGVPQDTKKALKWFQEAAELDPHDEGYTLLQLGRCHQFFADDIPNYSFALQCYESAAEEGAVAWGLIGWCYLYGQGAPRDFDKAFDAFSRATDDDEEGVLADLGLCYEYGLGVEANPEYALTLYQSAIDEDDDPAGALHVAICLLRGRGADVDVETAIELLESLGDDGHPLAQWEVGWCTALGLGELADPEEAWADWETAAKDTLCVPSEESVSRLREDTSLHHGGSLAWVQAEAKRGEAWAQHNLGVFYEEGFAMPPDHESAYAWYKLAAEQGVAAAQDCLGQCYELGMGVQPNFETAAQWFRAAADQGRASAQNSTGYCYYWGYGYRQDYDEAFRWYKKAAHQNNGLAAFRIAQMHETGTGIPQDLEQALKWHTIASETGLEEAEAALRRLAANRLAHASDADRFAMEIIEELQLRGEDREIHYDRDHFRLYPVGDDELLYVNLDNFYREYMEAEAEQQNRVIERVVRSWSAGQTEIPANFEEASSDLLPAVRPLSYFEFIELNMRLEEATPGQGWPHQVIGEHLGVGLVYDMQETMHFVSANHLELWGVSEYAAFEAAFANLRETAQPLFAQPTPGVYFADCRDSYDASRIMLHEVISQFDLQGEPIAMIPNRETLIVTGDQDEEGLSVMVEAAGAAARNGRLISELAFRLEDGEWRPWMPHVDHSQRHHFKRLQIRYFDRCYSEQTDLFNDLSKRSDIDTLVEYQFRLDPESASLVSYCVWNAAATGLLPLTDEIVFVAQENGQPSVLGACSFAQAQQVLGDSLIAKEYYPPRFEAVSFPTSDQLASLELKPAPSTMATSSMNDFSLEQQSPEGDPLYSTTRCGLYGHPEFVVPCSERTPLEGLIEFLAIGENMVASGAAFQAGQTLQFSWLILKMEKYDTARLTIHEPDMKSWPVEYHPGVSMSLKHAADHVATLQSVGLDPRDADTPHMRQSVQVSGDYANAQTWSFHRIDPVDDSDSGWHFDAIGAELDEPTSETISLYELFIRQNDTVCFFCLPVDTTIYFDQGRVTSIELRGEKVQPLKESFLAKRYGDAE